MVGWRFGFFRKQERTKAFILCNHTVPGDRPARHQRSRKTLSWQHPSLGASKEPLGETCPHTSSAWNKYKLYCHRNNYLCFIFVRAWEIKFGSLLATTEILLLSFTVNHHTQLLMRAADTWAPNESQPNTGEEKNALGFCMGLASSTHGSFWAK